MEWSNASWCSPEMSMTSIFSTARQRLSVPFGRIRRRKRTVARHLRKGNVHGDDELLSPATVDDDGGVGVDLAVVDEFEKGERANDGGGEHRHCKRAPLSISPVSTEG